MKHGKAGLQWRTPGICVAIPLVVGGVSAFVSRKGMQAFQKLAVKPPWTPPGWLFPLVWTVLYLLMGLASCRVVTSRAGEERIRPALWVYGLQLVVNFFWSPLFFNAAWYLAAFFWLLLLWVLTALAVRHFAQIDRCAGRLLLPTLLWVTFAGYLNFGVWWLN